VLRAVIVAVSLFVLINAAWITLNLLARRIRLRGRSFQPHPADTAVVLGAYTHGFEPSTPLKLRLQAALRLYRQGYVRYIIVSGGQGKDESVAESSSMKRFLVMNGVHPEDIIEDRLSTDTWENLRNSQHAMERAGCKTAIVVTSDYHLPRAMAVARQLEIDATGYAAWSSNEEFPFARREVFAWLAYWKDGQVKVGSGSEI